MTDHIFFNRLANYQDQLPIHTYMQCMFFQRFIALGRWPCFVGVKILPKSKTKKTTKMESWQIEKMKNKS